VTYIQQTSFNIPAWPYMLVFIVSYKAQTLLGLGCPNVGHMSASDTNTTRHIYDYTELYHFLKLLSVSACRCPCCVRCLCPCFI